jgi:glucosylceramidase
MLKLKPMKMSITRYYLLFIQFAAMPLTAMAQNALDITVYETSSSGHKLTLLQDFSARESAPVIKIQPRKKFQTIIGFGGSFTEASASLLNRMSDENRDKIIQAYFGENGAKYSLTRTHMNSCDFSLSNYSYASVEGDKELKHFSIEHDRADIIPMIKDAQEASSDGFKILSSPWTAPPWMKDNNSYVGGKLLPEYYDTWALFFSKYIDAYKAEGIDIWGFTVENEPLGNDNNWESMHFTAEEMTHFVANYLGPKLEADGHDVKILGYDQNRGEELKRWVDVMYANKASKKYYDGTAVHWYASTFDYFPESLRYTHKAAPNKYIIQSEACIDGIVPKWNDDAWYWAKEATDWGWTWASAEEKHLHPKYVPVFRYARDIIGCMNNRVNGWIDWNMVLDKQGGPNWFKNWCGAPVLVDPEKDEVYMTPLYYVMAHFSKFIRPGAKVIGYDSADKDLMVSAAKNPDGSIIVMVLNQRSSPKSFTLRLGSKTAPVSISAKALQTIVFTNELSK